MITAEIEIMKEEIVLIIEVQGEQMIEEDITSMIENQEILEKEETIEILEVEEMIEIIEENIEEETEIIMTIEKKNAEILLEVIEMQKKIETEVWKESMIEKIQNNVNLLLKKN